MSFFYFFCFIRFVTNVREKAPPLGVKSESARNPTTTRVLYKRELTLLKTPGMDNICEWNISCSCSSVNSVVIRSVPQLNHLCVLSCCRLYCSKHHEKQKRK